MKRLMGLFVVLTLVLSACGAQTQETEQQGIEFGLVEQEVFRTVDAYVKARLLSDLIATSDFSQYSAAQLESLTQQAIEAWNEAETSAQDMDKSATLYLDRQQRISNRQNPNSLLPSLFLTVHGSDPATEWAESFTQQYDAIKGAQRLKQLAAQLGTDAKNAFKQLQMAQDILQRDAANAEGDLYQKWQNIMEATKTASKAGLFVVGTIVTAGGSAAAAGGFGLAQSSAVIVSGVDVILDVGTTSSNIILGRDNQVALEFDKMKNSFAPVSFVFGLNGFSSASAGEKLSFIGDSLTDWFYENKIAGIKLDSKGNVVKGSEWMVDTKGKSDQDVKAELSNLGQSYPTFEPVDFEDLLESLGFDVDEFFDTASSAKPQENTGSNSTGSVVNSPINGTYRGVLIVYDSSGNAVEDEDEEASLIYVTLRSDGLFVSDDDEDSWLMDYNPLTQTAVYEESEGIGMSFTFNTSSAVSTIYVVMNFNWDGEKFQVKGTLTQQP
jgi:hypothetical protein